jgi:RNA polymerase sigma-70 factor (ECF subfamily)
MKHAPGCVDTTDVANELSYRLYETLAEIQPATVRDFFRLAAQRIRWLLLDLARQVDRMATEYDLERPDANRPEPPAVLEALYRQIELLPENERDVVDLLYFHNLSQSEVAAHLGITERTVRRHWALARVRLFESLKDTLPGGPGMMMM